MSSENSVKVRVQLQVIGIQIMKELFGSQDLGNFDELIGQEGVVVGIDGGDGIVKLGADIKIIQLSHLAMLAEAAVPPPAAPT